MSKIGKPSTSKGAIPKQVSKPGQKGKAGKSGKGKKEEEKKKDVVEWQLPAFGIPPQKQKQEINWERIKKDTARRHAPEGEDIKEIRRILKEVKYIDVPVHEFINMVGPYTSDQGATMRSVMAEDLESFRKLAKKVYETMTQDVSDVLVNEQLQMVQYYEEKNGILTEKMMRAINEIYEMAPDFDFEKFLKDKDDYLLTLFPMPREAQEMMSDEAFEMVRRQQAYHRLQWLRSEGERMSEENKRLMRRLEDLKKEQQEEQNRAAEQAAEAETKRQQLAQEENEMKDKLEKLNESIEKSFIRDELKMTQEHNRTAMQKPSESETDVQAGRSTGAIRRTRSGAGGKKPKPKKPTGWSSKTAADIEEGAVKSVVATETGKKSASKTSVKRPKSRAAKPPPKQTSPFHFSPPKTPPQERGPVTSTQLPDDTDFVSFGKAKPKKQAKPPSPFHYSPPRTPPELRGPSPPPPQPRIPSPRTPPQSVSKQKERVPKKQKSPFHYSPPKTPPEIRAQMQEQARAQMQEQAQAQAPPQMQETRIEESSTTVQQKRPQPRVRQTMAPKDSWGGFF